MGVQTDIVADGSNNNEIDKETINNIKTYEKYRRATTLFWPDTIFKVTSQGEETTTRTGKDVDLIVWDKKEKTSMHKALI